MRSTISSFGRLLDRSPRFRRPSRIDPTRWTISQRLGLVVAALALPLNILVVAVIFNLASSSAELQKTGLLYSARSVAAGVDAHLGKYIAVANDLMRSPNLRLDDLGPFEQEARQALAGMPDAWVMVADLNGQQLLNTTPMAHKPLPVRAGYGLEKQREALATRSVIVAGVRHGTVVPDWIATVEAPVYKDDKPFRGLSIAISLPPLLDLLRAQEVPRNWRAGIFDAEGHVAARVPDNDLWIGKLVTESYRKVRHNEGVYEVTSVAGDPIVVGSARSKASGWSVGVAVPAAMLTADAWSTVRWAVILGGCVSLLSLLLAISVARSITQPIDAMRRNAVALVAGASPRFEPGTPEMGELWNAIERAVGDHRRSDAEISRLSEQLAAIVTSSRDAILSKTLEGIITSWNRSAQQMFGYSAQEIVGTSIRRLIAPDRQGEEDEILAKIGRGEAIENYETVRLHKSGRLIDVSVTISPVRDAQGKIFGASKFIRDVTERKRQERMLVESEQRASQIINTVNAFVGMMDNEGVLTEVNTRALDVSGMERDRILGRPIWEVPWWRASPDGPIRMRDITARCLAGETVRCDLEYMTGDGEVRWVDFQAAPILGGDGKVLAAVPSGVDITDRKRSEEQIRLLLLEVNHRSKNMLSLVLAIARHTAAVSRDDFVARFTERVQALSANQDLLVKNDWRGTGLRELVEVQLAHFADLIGKRICIEGPDLFLNAGASQGIGMALHELATNAGKYGALSNDRGRIDITWRISDERLSMRWVERDGPRAAPPARKGFGSTVLTSLAQMSVSGVVVLEYGESGLVWQIDCPAAKAIELSLAGALENGVKPFYEAPRLDS